MKAIPLWTWAFPFAAAIVLAVVWPSASGPLAIAAGLALVAAVFAGVHHAEEIAHQIGEPFGTLVLAIAVTIIEVGLIVSLMLGGGADKSALARDTVFAAVMIVCNGLVGLCLLSGGVRHHRQDFQVQGASAALAVLAALTTLSLVLPNYTMTTPGPVFSTSQLAFAGVVSLVLYGAFVFVQTIRHREDFLDEEDNSSAAEGDLAAPPLWAAAALLIVSLVAVVGLAKALTQTVETGVAAIGAPKSVVGIVIAALVLLPESWAALNAARANRLQTSLNLALGSALASIALTIPVVAAVSIVLDIPLTLGLGLMQQILLALTLFIAVITLGTGRTTILQGVVHLVIFAAFLFLAIVP
ncbi:MAG: ionic transporter y4hA [Methylobacteriaceae bacterium]|nr:ionic transporter y4hA [Methylobacteriaceae bacterium]